jgi:hypothetical protein
MSEGDIAMSDRLGALLLKAIDQLDEAERGEVLQSVLGAFLSGPPARLSPQMRASFGSEVRAAHYLRFVDQLASERDQPGAWKVVPIRLSEDLYDRLRSWSQEQGFPMAVVIRGLVERFLDGQSKDSNA